MKSESAELVSGLIRQYRRLRLLYLGYLAAAVLALVFFFVDKRVTLALVAASLVYHLVVVRRAGEGLPAGLCPRLRPVYPGPAPSGRPPYRSAHPGGGGAAPRPPGSPPTTPRAPSWCGRAAPVPTTAAVCAWVTPGLPIPSPWRGKPTTSSWWAPG